MNRTIWALGALVLVTIAWGSTFFVIKDALDDIGTADFLATRFTIAALPLIAVSWRRLMRLSWRQWRTGLGLGVIYGVGQLVQTEGLRYTDASVSGFITGTYVIITPLLMWMIFRRSVSPRTWVSVGMAATGLAVLSLTGMAAGGIGELLTLMGASLYALHIVFLDRSTDQMDALSLTTLQLIGVAATCSVVSLPTSRGELPDAGAWTAILYTALVAGALTMLLQTWAQGYLSPTRVAVVMTLEPVFATAFAVAMGGESFTVRLLVGGSLILAATLIGVLARDKTHLSTHHPTDPDPPPDPGDHHSASSADFAETAHTTSNH